MKHNLLITIATDFEPATSSGWTETDVPIPTRKSNKSKGDMIISYNFITFVSVVVGLAALERGRRELCT